LAALVLFLVLGCAGVGGGALAWRRHRGAPPGVRHLSRDPRLSALLVAALYDLVQGRVSRGLAVPDVQVVLVGDERVVVHFAGVPDGRAFAPWRSELDGQAWVVEAADLRQWQRGELPFPALVTLGEVDGWSVLVDLEQAPGLISLGGDPRQARRVAGAVAFELATSGWSGASVTLVGFEPDAVAVPSTARVSHADLAGTLAAAEPLARRATARLGHLDAANLATGRTCGVPLPTRVLLLAEPPPEAEVDRIARLAGDGHTPVVIACLGDTPYARWRFTATPDGHLDLHPLGLHVRPLTTSVEAHQRQLRTATLPTTPTTSVALTPPPTAAGTVDPDGWAAGPGAARGKGQADISPPAPGAVDAGAPALPTWSAPAGAPAPSGPVAPPPASPAVLGTTRGPVAWPREQPGVLTARPPGTRAPETPAYATDQAEPTVHAVAAPTAAPPLPVAPPSDPAAIAPHIAVAPQTAASPHTAAPAPRIGTSSGPDGASSGTAAAAPHVVAVGPEVGWRAAIGGLERPVLDGAERERMWPAAVRVGVLGPVEVWAAGRVPEGSREVLTELAVAAAVHPDGLPEAEVVRRLAGTATVADVVGMLAGWVGGLAERPGGWWLPGALVDWSLFRELVSGGEPGNERARLVTALGLVRGEPAPVAGYAGEAVRRATVGMPGLVAATASRAAELAWQAGDAGNAEWSLRRGLALAPAAQPLWRQLLTVRAAHDPATAREVAGEALAAVGQPDPATRALLARLAPAAAR
jgi:hypothetical protein